MGRQGRDIWPDMEREYSHLGRVTNGDSSDTARGGDSGSEGGAVFGGGGCPVLATATIYLANFSM